MYPTVSKILILLTLTAGASCAFADAPTDIRPVWATSGQMDVPLNSSILFSNQNPTYIAPAFGSQLIGQKRVNELNQDYEDRNRNYEMRSNYGIATQGDEMDHENSMKDMAHSVVNSAKNAQIQPYGQNVDQAQKQGDISQPLIYAGGAVGIASGTPVKVKLGHDTQASVSANAMNRQSQLDLKTSDVTASARMD